MTVRFLLDENISPQVRKAILHHYPHLDILCIGDPEAPSLQTLDPEILQYLESSCRLLITKNRKTMPGHIADHLAKGGQHWGIFWVRHGTSIADLAEILNLLDEASEAEEWLNKVDWIPY
jgi:hypothetical protein